MNLQINISPSEKEISSIIGKQNWVKLIEKNKRNNSLQCVYCNFPNNESNIKNINPILRNHILPYDKNLDLTKNFEDLKVVVVCDACHALQHFDNGVKMNWFKLVNSNFDQVDLVKICRWGNKMVNAYILGDQEIEKNIFLLKKTPDSYLREIKESNFIFNEKIKVIFTKNFDWSNSR